MPLFQHEATASLQEKAWVTHVILVVDDKASGYLSLACYKSILTI